MTRAFNPYQAWLGLGERLLAPNHFELLGLDQGEEDPKAIAAAADRAASRVRAIRPGPQAAEWAQVLDKIAEAKRCLTNSRLRWEYRQSLQAGTGPDGKRGRESPSDRHSSRKPTAPSPIDPNMFPPGMAPAMAPYAAPQSPIAPVPGSQPSPTDAAMQPYSPGRVPQVPVAVPYLQPADSSTLPDPMRPLAPTSPGSAGLYPMAPLATTMSATLAPVPNATRPLAGVPLAIPLSAPPSPPMAYPAGLPVGATPQSVALPAYPAPVEPNYSASIQPVGSSVTSAEQPIRVSKSSASMQSARHTNSGSLVPIVLGAGVGLALLALATGIFYWNSRGGSGSEGSQAADAGSPEPLASEPSATTSTTSPISGTPFEIQTTHETSAVRPTGGNPEPANVEPSASSGPATATSPKPNEPPTPPEPTPAPTPPVPEPTSEPATATPAKMADMPEPTKEELAKLALAFQKARQAIEEHNFDRAAAFLEVAGEMPRLPEHQAMLDRLKLLSDCVDQYRAAIQESLGKLAAGSSFEVGETRVGVVETGAEKIVFRVNGQNRPYTLADLPVGLAAALAAQTLAADDPNTLALKGAYILASPKASDEEREKAQEFLEEAAKSVDAAQSLLLLLKDQYNFTDP